LNRLSKPLGEPRLTQYVSHVRAYAELLFRAGLLEQFIEVLKVIPSFPHLIVDGLNSMEWDGLGESTLPFFLGALHLTRDSFGTDMSKVWYPFPSRE
jgi:hypothetical protein